jgi:hypothetical protein
MEGETCPPAYETFIDMIRPSNVKYVVWFFFDKLKGSKVAECRNCHEEIPYGNDTVVLVDHLKTNHYFNDGPGFNNSYENYMEHLAKSVKYKSYEFPEVQIKHLKLSFGVRYAEKFNLIRLPVCRKGRKLYPDKVSFKSDWQKKVCKTYIDNPVGSYQGHFDRPMIAKVYSGSRPLSFKEYTEFTHSPPDNCCQYVINVEKYKNLNDLEKIKALEVSKTNEDLKVEGPASRDRDMSILYTCIKHGCIFPCVCKDCVLEEKQCKKHEILHPGYFDVDNHAMTVREDDSHNINLVRDDFSFDPNSIIEVIKYAGIENDVRNCKECPVDLHHHQAYHFVHHELCKFCRNEKHKYEGVKTLKISHENMKDKYNDEKLSCHFCNKLFQRKENKDKHVLSQHRTTDEHGIKCDKCTRFFQSKQAIDYHKKTFHLEETEDHQCPLCQKSFKTKHSLNVHNRSVHNRRNFRCKKCHFVFKLHAHLIRHYRLVHDIDLKTYNYYQDQVPGPSYHSCDYCDFKTVYKQNLALHIESSHLQDKDAFQCEKCSFQTVYQRNLTRHNKKVHSQEPFFQCNFCDFSTGYKDNLRRHKDEQHGIRGKGMGIQGRQSYSCNRCEFVTMDEETMYNHNRTFPHD